MYRGLAGVASLLVLTLSLGACADGPSKAPSAEEVPLVSDTSPRGRLAVGCALERGLDDADATTEHYTRMGTHHLFVAALEARPGYVAAANLWNASDQLGKEDAEQARSDLLRLCSAAGFEDQADLAVLRSYACTLNDELIKDRPNLASFGPKSTRQASGDHRRTDALFVDLARFLLSMKEDPEWLDGGTPGTELDLGTDDSYRGALHDIATQCSSR